MSENFTFYTFLVPQDFIPLVDRPVNSDCRLDHRTVSYLSVPGDEVVQMSKFETSLAPRSLDFLLRV